MGVRQNSLVLCAINGESPLYTLEIYADVMTVRGNLIPPEYRNAAPTGGTSASKRGKVTKYSKKSEKRLLERFARKVDYTRPIFITLTYPDEVWCDRNLTGRDLKKHIELLRHRLEYEYPDVGGIWRVEIEDRKSGRYIGRHVPHIHMIIDNVINDVADIRVTMRKIWSEILQVERAITDVSTAKNRKHAYYYLAKYTAKVSEISHSQIDDIGRWWAVFGNWDMTPFATIRITLEEARALRRTLSAWLKSKGNRYHRRLKQQRDYVGYTVFGMGAQSSRKYRAPPDSAVYKLVETLCPWAL